MKLIVLCIGRPVAEALRAFCFFHFLAFNRPFEMYDTIEVEDTVGKVKALHLRTTHILTFDSKDVYIPSSTILASKLTSLTNNGLIRMGFVGGIDNNDKHTGRH